MFQIFVLPTEIHIIDVIALARFSPFEKLGPEGYTVKERR